MISFGGSQSFNFINVDMFIRGGGTWKLWQAHDFSFKCMHRMYSRRGYKIRANIDQAMAGAAGVAPPALFIHDSGGQNDWKATTAEQYRQAPSSITASQNCSSLFFHCSRTIEAKNIAAIISHRYFSQHVRRGTFTCIVSKQWSCLCVVHHRWLVSCADFLVVVVCWVSTITSMTCK